MSAKVTMRGLRPEDLDAVVRVDSRTAGHARNGFFEKRLAAAKAAPKSFITVAATEGDALVGYAFARIQQGEFGGVEPVAVLDAIGVDPDRQGEGIGRQMLGAVEDKMRKAGVRKLRTQAEWGENTMLGFFAATGFDLAPQHIVERPAHGDLDF